MWEAVGWILAEKDSAESDFDSGFQHRRWKACGRDRNVFLAITAPCAAVLPRCSPLLRTIDTGQPPSRGRMRRMAYTILLVDRQFAGSRTLRSVIEPNRDWKVCGEAENGASAVNGSGVASRCCRARPTSFVETLSERSFRLAHLGVNQCLQAALAPSFLEPDFLAGTNITAHFPPILLQRLQLITVGAKPQRNPLPLTIRFRKRNRHFGSPFGCNYTLGLRVSRHTTLSGSRPLTGTIRPSSSSAFTVLRLADTGRTTS